MRGDNDFPIAVIGTGLAGFGVVRELRKLDQDCKVMMLTADDGGYCYKPSLSNALTEKKGLEQLSINSRGKMAQQLGVVIHGATRISAISPAENQAQSEDGAIYSYSRLVLATGGTQNRLNLDVTSLSCIWTVNDLQSYVAFRRAIEGKKSVLICGAGLIGCEFANDLVNGGYDVTVMDISPMPLSRLVPPQVGSFIQDRLGHAGIKWHLNSGISEVCPTSDAFSVKTSDGVVFRVDAVLSATGLSPNTHLAHAAGLSVNKGIVVNRRLQTSDPWIFAIGDCVEIEGKIFPYVLPIMHAARTVAANLIGRSAELRYPAMPVTLKTPACPTIVAPPLLANPANWQIVEAIDGMKALHFDDAGALTGFVLCGAAVQEKTSLTAKLPMVLGLNE